jgi:putative phosphoribosyl transferase
MTFASRTDAGKRLGRLLRDEGLEVDLVLGLPRGGVVVAAAVSRVLHQPLDVLAVRKIGHPWYREFAVGALAEPDVVILDEDSLRRNPVGRAQLDEVIAEETGRLRQYQAEFHRRVRPGLAGKRVVLVDDGLATGATMEAAVRAARRQEARRVTVAVPVASTHAVQRLEVLADAVKALLVDDDFRAVGQYYAEFSQTSDAEVLRLLDEAAAEEEP